MRKILQIIFLTIAGLGLLISPAKALVFTAQGFAPQGINMPVLPQPQEESSIGNNSGIFNLNAILNNSSNNNPNNGNDSDAGIVLQSSPSSSGPWSIPLPNYTAATVTTPNIFDPRFSSLLTSNNQNTLNQNTLLNISLSSPFAATKALAISGLNAPNLTTFLQSSIQPVWNAPFNLDNLSKPVIENVVSSLSGLELNAVLNNPNLGLSTRETIFNSPQARNKLASLGDSRGIDIQRSGEENQMLASTLSSYKSSYNEGASGDDYGVKESSPSVSGNVSLSLHNTSGNLMKLVKNFKANDIKVDPDVNVETLGDIDLGVEETRHYLNKNSEGKTEKDNTSPEELPTLASEGLDTPSWRGENPVNKNEPLPDEAIDAGEEPYNDDSENTDSVAVEAVINEIKQAQRASQKRLLETMGELKDSLPPGKIQVIYQEELERLQDELDRIIKESQPQESFYIEFEDGFFFKLIILPKKENNKSP